jgi:hypothetical protein
MALSEKRYKLLSLLSNNPLPIKISGDEIAFNDVTEITDTELVPYIEQRSLQIRSERVMLDRDLARVYGVETRRLNEQLQQS